MSYLAMPKKPKLTVIEGGAPDISPAEQVERDLERILEKLEEQKMAAAQRRKSWRNSKKSWRP